MFRTMQFVRDFKYLLAYLIPFWTFTGLYLHGLWCYGGILFAFGLIPIGEAMLGYGLPKAETNTQQHRLANGFFDTLLYFNVVFIYGGALLFAQLLASNTLEIYEVIGLTLSVGVMFGANGINVGHELGHRGRPWERWIARVLLLPSLYLHFYIEHNRGHHINVGTHPDPSTARFGESLYFFWPRTMVMTYLNAWKIEQKRLQTKRTSGLYRPNAMIGYTLCTAGYLATFAYFFGPRVMIGLIGAATIGALLLETINYIEHYGLTRTMLPSGKVERVTEQHSWNSNHQIGRIVLYELTRHSDHHATAGKPYQALNNRPAAPQLPFGYPTCMLLALCPPLWFKIMHPRLQQLK